MSEKFENKRPFAETLTPSSFTVRLSELKEHPHIVVRRSRLDVSTKEKLAEEVVKLNENKALFATVEEAGMRVAKFDYAIGNKGLDGWAESYALVEKIDGENLADIKKIDAEAAQEVDRCYAAYLEHLLWTIREGGRYWSDMHADQIVYGTRENDTEPHAYVVDLDPFWDALTSKEERKDNPPKVLSEIRVLVGRLRALYIELREAERKMNGNGQLLMTHRKFYEVAEKVSPIVAEFGSRQVKEDFSLLQKELKKS